MSQENMAIVQASFDVGNTGDMDAYGELLDPDVITHAPEGWPEPGPFVGREAALRQFVRVRDALDGDAAEPIGDFVEVDDRVVVRWAWRGRGHGPAVNMEMSCVYTVRQGTIADFDFFWDHVEALEAVGAKQPTVRSLMGRYSNPDLRREIRGAPH